ncbi:MAG: DNA sulfur modification protein DndB [Blastocatellia bacterium]|nr:DNA sulfur modification protein DndB [Blastocatellia bacterium]
MTEKPILTNLEGEREFDTLQEARESAFDEATASGGRVYPCTVFQQGGRWMISTSFPFPFLAKQVRLDPATKGGNPRNNMNRPLMPDHVKSIRNYLIQNAYEYILPPVTLNLRTSPQLYVQRSTYPMKSGYLVVGDATMFDVTDGQHRIAAIAGSATSRPAIPAIYVDDDRFEKDSMAVLLVVEPDMSRIHQDFADAAQTKSIPASLLAAYNTREPINRVLTRLVDGSHFLSGRVDETSKTLPKLSQSVFLLNQVRGFVKELLVGDYGLSEDSLARSTSKLLSTTDQQDNFVNRASELIKVLTETMEPWSTIAKISVNDTMANQIPEFRQKYVNMTGTGLIVIGRVAFEIQKRLPEDARMVKYKELATKIDWTRNGVLWNGSILIEGRIVSSRKPVQVASQRVIDALGLPPVQVTTERVKQSMESSD